MICRYFYQSVFFSAQVRGIWNTCRWCQSHLQWRPIESPQALGFWHSCWCFYTGQSTASAASKAAYSTEESQALQATTWRSADSTRQTSSTEVRALRSREAFTRPAALENCMDSIQKRCGLVREADHTQSQIGVRCPRILTDYSACKIRMDPSSANSM